MLHERGDAVLDYVVHPVTGKRDYPDAWAEISLDQVAKKFHQNPAVAQFLAAINFEKIMGDRRMNETPQQRLARGKGYVEDYLALILKLDFGMPTAPTQPVGYLPQAFRYESPGGRTPITVEKAKIYMATLPFIQKILLFPCREDNNSIDDFGNLWRISEDVTERLAADTPLRECYPTLNDIASDTPQGSARFFDHLAVTTQVLAQTVGLSSQLTEVRVNGVATSATITTIGNQHWFIGPGPEMTPAQGPFLKDLGADDQPFVYNSQDRKGSTIYEIIRSIPPTEINVTSPSFSHSTAI